jgi:prolyl 4-hydroxylase|tara:strand:- start:506 stop:1027 length:522 start_codon:yes stop_codon:yes gene_type:complete
MFISENYIDKKICKNLIETYEKTNKKESINYKKIKMTQSIFNINDPSLFNYLKKLNNFTKNYIKKYKHCDYGQETWDIYPNIKIQKYEPNENYGEWHSESTGYQGNNNRILVFSTFLNDIKKGGETEFFYQKQKIKAEEGKTIIFPAYWTHTHKGNITNEIKYIITGWYTYVH